MALVEKLFEPAAHPGKGIQLGLTHIIMMVRKDTIGHHGIIQFFKRFFSVFLKIRDVPDDRTAQKPEVVPVLDKGLP